ncbi:MAG: cytochrome c biogenesis protein CcsA [Opitutaceae bacterium]|jgi:ABC-type transport system involved in cytochrome c biogenesis permease subunit
MKRFIPLAFLLLSVVCVIWTFRPARNTTDFDLVAFGRLPALVNGRVKPIDSVARTSLLVLQGRQRVVAPDGRQIDPSEWLLDVMLRPGQADAMQVFEIVHPEVLALLNLQPEDGAGKKRFSPDQIKGHIEELSKQARMAAETESAGRSTFQKAVLQLNANIDLYQRLRLSILAPDTADFLAELKRFQEILPQGIAAVQAKEAGQPYDETLQKEMLEYANRYSFLAENAVLLPIPPAPGTSPDAWRSIGAALLDTFKSGQVSPHVLAYAGLAYAWRAQKTDAFNVIVRLYGKQLASSEAPVLAKCRIETLFNSSQPFYTAAALYCLAFLFAIISWIAAPQILGRSAFWLLIVAFVLTTAGIATRMWLEARPPVTNLYSSALFVGWVAVALCIVIESLYRNAVASVAAGFVGFCTLVIAHHLALGGDTMEMMRAVLDSNFWLATHVVSISIGYGATFLAGFLALIYVIRGLFTKSLDQATADSLSRMVYGIVCFATLFSLVGTVLGGIWADQSWGRFWGWDPKENGALIIVIWNAIILHVRWGGFARQRGIMCLAIFGNVVTAWSWFGVNMLGVGLHSYGFMDSAFWWLIAFVVSQIVVISIAMIPLERWRSPMKA